MRTLPLNERQKNQKNPQIIHIIGLQRLQKSFDNGTERLGQGAGGGGHPQKDTQVVKGTVARDEHRKLLLHYMAA
jgi:hypothetical protein